MRRRGHQPRRKRPTRRSAARCALTPARRSSSSRLGGLRSMAGMPEHAHHGAPELRRSAASSWQIAFQLSQLPGRPDGCHCCARVHVVLHLFPGDLAQPIFLDLAAVGAGKFVHDQHPARHLVGGYPVAGEAEQFRFIGSRAGAQPHEGDRHVALVFPPHADQLGDLDRGVRLQLFLYLLGVDQVAAQAQRVVQPGQVDECRPVAPARGHRRGTSRRRSSTPPWPRGCRGSRTARYSRGTAAHPARQAAGGRAGTGCDATDLHVRGDQIPAAAGPGGGGCLLGPGAHQREALR